MSVVQIAMSGWLCAVPRLKLTVTDFPVLLLLVTMVSADGAMGTLLVPQLQWLLDNRSIDAPKNNTDSDSEKNIFIFLPVKIQQ
ncbi:MAG TPA: hypothetical protein DDX98_00705 [Bacteroidales bacterium]|jgi:hypothetical protein|nr:hypothetical protein [Bacteroidales bacterium]